MRKVGSSGPGAAAISGSKEASVKSDVQSSKADSTPKPAESQSPVLTKDQQSKRKAEKGMSGVMKQAAFTNVLHESNGKGKEKVASTQGASAVSESKDSAPMTPVKVNVLAHTPNELNLTKVGESVKDRLEFFDRMCAKANAGIPQTKLAEGEKKLNVMVAPEWLFARHGTKAYTPTECQRISEGLVEMSKKYPDMMIVGGSISWEMPNKPDPKGPPSFTMYNTSPVVQNGKMVHMYHKRVEGGETTVPADEKGTVQKKWGMDDPGIRSKLEHSNPAVASNSSIFTHKGMTFSMEICADSASGESLKEYTRAHPDGKGTDMHILISVGSPYQPVRTPVKNGGIMVHVDGKYDARLPKSGVATVGVISRPDMAISDWFDQKEARRVEPGYMPKSAGITSKQVDDKDLKGAVPEQEQVHLFTGMTVMVPKKS